MCVAVRDGLVKGARKHYVSSGFYAHRMPAKTIVDKAWYLETYEDVPAAVHDAVLPSGETNFETLAYRGRSLPFSGFSQETTRHDA
jgi:hypothetical protein